MFKVKVRSTIDAPVDDMAFQEDVNDNPPTLYVVDLEDEETMIEHDELMERDHEEGDSSQDGDENEAKDENENEDQYLYDDEDKDEDDNGED